MRTFSLIGQSFRTPPQDVQCKVPQKPQQSEVGAVPRYGTAGLLVLPQFDV